MVSETQRAIADNDLKRAAAIARAAAQAGLKHPLLSNLMAFDLEQEGRLTEALTVLSAALQSDPDSAQLLHAQGQCLSKLGRFSEAVTAFDAALARRRDFAPTLHHKGAALESMGHEVAARACYAAAAADSQYADPHAGLASIAIHRGELEAARQHAQRALQLEPRQPIALLALARVALAEQQPEQAETQLRQLLAEPGLHGQDRPAVLGLLADAMDAQQHFAEAFRAYAAAKQEGARNAATLMTDAPDYRRLAELAAQCLEELPAWPASGGGDVDSPARAHSFLIGFPRSGTTLLEQVLDAHPDVVTLDERATLDAAVAEYLGSESGFTRLLALEGEALEALRAAYWQRIGTSGVDLSGKVFIDKLPLNTINLALIARLFPEARILFAVRDPRDVVWSCFRRTFRMNAAMREFTSLERTAEFYVAVMRCAVAAREKLPLATHRVVYERLVEDFRAETHAVCAFLGISFDERMLDFAARAADRPIATPSASQVRKGLYRDGIGQWRRYSDALAPILPLLRPWMDEFGYAP